MSFLIILTKHRSLKMMIAFSCHGNAFARGNWYRGYTFGVFRQNEEKLPVAAVAELRRKMRLGARLFLRQ